MNYSEQTTKIIQAHQRTLTVIWSALCMTLLMITFVSFIINQQPQNNDKLAPAMALPLALLSLVAVAMSFLIKKVLLPDDSIEKVMTDKNDTIDYFKDLKGVDEDFIAKVRPLPVIEKKIIYLIKRYFTWTMVRLAMHETVTLMGLLVSLTQHNFIFILPFTAFSLMLNILAFPKLPAFTDQLMTKYDR